MDRLSRFRVCFLALLNETSSYNGKCDGCGASGVPIMKLSLGRDFFGRVYDRLSPSADLSPKWYCDTCSIEKNLQRDFRDIQQEFSKLHKGDSSVLDQYEQLQRATLRLKEIAALISGATLKQRLLKTDEVTALSHSLESHLTTPT
jgi:hypothetical protein